MNDYRQALLALRTQLEAIARTGDESAAVVELDQARVGRLSRMDAMQAQAIAASSKQRRASKLREIDAALRRIDAEEFGICAGCDGSINPKRLDFDPTVRFCIDCASRREG